MTIVGPSASAMLILVPSKLFTHREFAFTLAGDVYIRYNSFHTVEDFKKEVIRLNPSRFEIGPQYSARVGAPGALSLRSKNSPGTGRHCLLGRCNPSGESWCSIST